MAIQSLKARLMTPPAETRRASPRQTVRGLRDNMRSALAEIGKLKAEADCLRAWQNGQIQGLNRLSDEIRHKNDLIERLTRANAELHKAVEVEKGFSRQLWDTIAAAHAAGARQRNGAVKRWDAADFATAARRVEGEFAGVGEAASGTAHKT